MPTSAFALLILALFGLCFSTAAIAQAAPPAEAAKAEAPAAQPPFRSVTLRGLNKATARSSTLTAPIGTSIRFGNLEIIPLTCWQSAPEDRPENAALLEVWEMKPDESPTRIFQGWMFSSSPSLSGLEHAVYDITVLSCDRDKQEEKPKAAEGKKPGN